MAYITKEKSAEIRKALKARFPDWKFSVKIRHHSSLDVDILSAPIDLLAYKLPGRYDDDTSKARPAYAGVNHYYVSENWASPAKEALLEIVKISNEGNHDNSDIQTDYFDVGWYYDLSIGTWDKPFVYTGPQQIAA